MKGYLNEESCCPGRQGKEEVPLLCALSGFLDNLGLRTF
jgi:hypothetical protein